MAKESKNEPQKTTALAVIERDSILALRDPDVMQDMQDAMQSAMESGVGGSMEKMFIRVKTPAGGGTQWTIQTPTGPENAEVIRGILVGVFPRGVLWPTEGEAKKGTRPVLKTDDLKTAYQVGDIPDDMIDVLDQYKREDGTWDWDELTGGKYPDSPFGWGSGKHGVGKRAHDQRVLFILREHEVMPLMIVIQPGSLKSILDFLAMIPSQAIPAWRAVVELSLRASESKGGIEYSEIIPRLVGKLDRENGAAIKATYYDVLKRSMMHIDEE